MTELDPQLDPWLSRLVLPWRAERHTTVSFGGTREAWTWFDYTCPVISDNTAQDNGCPHPKVGHMGDALGYEWSDDHQIAFQQALDPHMDFTRWDGLVEQLRSHWSNTTGTWGDKEIHYLAAIAPGIRPVVHELGKTSQFRSLRRMWLDQEELTGNFQLPQPGDLRLDDCSPEPSGNRANLIAARGMAQWYSTRYRDQPWQLQQCVICGDDFWPQLLSYTALDRVGLPRYCAPCVNIASSDVWGLGHIQEDLLKPVLITVVQKFHDITNVLPSQSVKLTDIAVLPNNERDTWMRLLMLMPRPDTVKNLFGSWREYLHAAGLLDGNARKGHAGYVTVANDGHVALSMGERRVCDWLDSHGIKHEKEVHYPLHAKFNPDGKLRADWLIGDCWVELAGRMTDPAYARKMSHKQDLAAACGLKHLVLLPAELTHLDAIAREHWAWTGPPSD